ncbi:MAG TPA: DUF2599 domain-containing protein [Candidatus Avanaerovorax faecigallinarum]|nr:DUF2599 domain-containing protein [Candidatus Avanaerovorax faecigallinarum]
MHVKKTLSLLLSIVLVTSTVLLPTSAAAENDTSIDESDYNLYELRVAYFEAVESGNLDKQSELLSIGRKLLDDFKAASKAYTPSFGPLRVDANELYWRGQFASYFEYGRFENRNGEICLSLKPKLRVYAPEQNRINGWNATFATFHNHQYWKNTECMEDQFYCHAQYGKFGELIGGEEWNLEPHKTSINPVTCN